MRTRFRASRRNSRSEGGYALLLVVFLTTLLLLATISAAPSVRTERQREKEEAMIWRGKQYVRAIKLYYRKNGRFPTTIDDLVKPKMGALRFLRQEYKDPMNKEDGKWRLIFVGPAGQLIGSLKPPQNIQFQGPGGGTQPGTAAGAPTSGFGGGFGSTPAAGGNPQQGTFGSQFGGTATGTAGTTQPGAPGTGTTDSGTTPNGGALAPAPVDTSTFVGGNIIGIGSKVDKSSIEVYEKATNYHLFEFIWDPSKDAMMIGGSTTQVGTPGAPGQQGPNQGNQGFGQGFGQGQQGAPGQPAQSPQPMGSPGSEPPLTPNAPPP